MAQDESLVPDIKTFLETFISPSMRIRMDLFDPTSRDRSADSLPTDYVKLLQAAFNPDLKMGISVGSIEGFHIRLYFEVYYPLISWGVRKHFDQEKLRAFFPAVSVRNQMALVPQGLAKQLRYASEGEYPLVGLDNKGTQEADFEDALALESAFEKVYDSFRSMFLQELCAYSRYQGERQLMLADVTRDLKMDTGFVQRVLRGQSVAFENSCYPALTCALDTERVQASRWTNWRCRSGTTRAKTSRGFRFTSKAQ